MPAPSEKEIMKFLQIIEDYFKSEYPEVIPKLSGGYTITKDQINGIVTASFKSSQLPHNTDITVSASSVKMPPEEFAKIIATLINKELYRIPTILFTSNEKLRTVSNYLKKNRITMYVETYVASKDTTKFPVLIYNVGLRYDKRKIRIAELEFDGLTQKVNILMNKMTIEGMIKDKTFYNVMMNWFSIYTSRGFIGRSLYEAYKKFIPNVIQQLLMSIAHGTAKIEDDVSISLKGWPRFRTISIYGVEGYIFCKKGQIPCNTFSNINEALKACL